jgi:hypothetical protein
MKDLHKMTETELKQHIAELETKITIYSDRDWLMTQSYIAQLKQADMRLLDFMCPTLTEEKV